MKILSKLSLRQPRSCTNFFALIILIGSTLSWGSRENRTADHRYGGTLTWGTAYPPTIINPVLTTSTVSAPLVALLFNNLVRINVEGNVEPALAESWEISSNQLVYTFHLRKGVKFHDGVECTAHDVKFTYDLIVDPAVESPFSSHFKSVERFEVVDNYTFRVVLKEKFVPLLSKMVRFILPRHLVDAKNIHQAEFNIRPVGTGPFKFESWDQVTHKVVLVANPDYFEGRPYLDRIVVRTYSTTENLWSAFMRQEVDLVNFINRRDFLFIQQDPTFKAYQILGEMYYALDYDVNDQTLSDKAVRKAISFAINRQEIIDQVMKGNAIESIGPFHPESVGFNREVRSYEYHPQEAQKVLAQAGWQDRNGDGILEKEGKDLAITLLVDGKKFAERQIAMMIRQHLSEVGIRLEITLYDTEKESQLHAKQGKAQAHLRLYQGIGLDPYEAASSWSSDNTQSGKLWDYANSDVDHILEAAKSVSDEQSRAEMYKEIHRLIYEDQPACFLFFPVSFHGVSARFRNTDEFFCLYMPSYTLQNWQKEGSDFVVNQ